MEEQLLPLLERIASAMETMALHEKKHYDLYQRECGKAETRYHEDQKLVRQQQKIQAEDIRRRERMAAALERADDRQAFAHDISRAALGLNVPDLIPPD